MSEPFIGEIKMFGGNFAPRGWAFCHGQLLPINEYPALFSLLGNTYGGDGRTTFKLPDLQGRAPVGQGRGPGLSERRLGEMFGAETVTLTTSQLPAHTHSTEHHLPFTEPMVPAAEKAIAYNPEAGGATAQIESAATGGGQPVPVSQPSIGINYIIALVGIYPSRS